jgi:hypothetical protein
VLLVDCSGSMLCKLNKMKEFLAEFWLPWRMGSPVKNQVALISFGNDVVVNSRYTSDLASLQTMVKNLTTGCAGGSLTSLYDAIIVASVFESPKPDGIYVWSDLQDTCSDAKEADYVNLANSVGVSYNLCPPYEWMQDPNCPYFSIIVTFPYRPIAYAHSVKIATALAGKLKMAKVIEKPEHLLAR